MPNVQMAIESPIQKKTFRIALAGNPNCGKTTLFNALTGLRQKVANYPGVTVEKKTGLWETESSVLEVIDLPGSYSLISRSPDEAMVRDLLSGFSDSPPDATICVVDITNLSRHLYLVGQVIELGRPVVVALTMVDEAERLGLSVNIPKLSAHLGVPVVEVLAAKGIGLKKLGEMMERALAQSWAIPPRKYQLPPALEGRLKQYSPQAGATELQTLLCVAGQHTPVCTEKLEKVAAKVRGELGVNEEIVRRFVAEARFKWQQEITREVVEKNKNPKADWTRKIDKFLLHPALGPLILLATLTLVFQSIFKWAQPPMDAIGYVTGNLLPSLAKQVLTPGPLLSLINDGIFAGVGAVIIFLPQILLLFFFLTVLEDSGYMARAAFLLDRLMSKVGLSGKSFIPLLSSFACAIPGIMATRTIPNRRDRLATILVAPLMTCSARLVVYTLLIAAFAPNVKVWGPFGLQGISLLGLYLLGILAAAGVAFLFRKTILRGPTPPLLLELPPYRLPRLKNLALTLLERAQLFLVSAGTIIFAVSILLWGLSSYPRWSKIENQFNRERAVIVNRPEAPQRAAAMDKLEQKLSAERLRHSFAGILGRAFEPVLEPLGFDWKIGVGILGSFAAREVFVSTMGVVYGVGSAADDKNLTEELKADVNPQTGAPVWTPLVAITLLVFYAFALQCMSTIAIMKRETNGWRWPAFAFVYMTVLAYGGALLTRWLGQAFF
ncbi:MAG: ferrous iron transport protein B [candidate division Zixibacteria bacterium]|nr:ferrous iron transport protein B [candidate division Zixibacteria bacterium]